MGPNNNMMPSAAETESDFTADVVSAPPQTGQGKDSGRANDFPSLR
jgi:hypothetical protein